jgi:hypothetical protein
MKLADEVSSQSKATYLAVKLENANMKNYLFDLVVSNYF